jgi:hypothetical protein
VCDTLARRPASNSGNLLGSVQEVETMMESNLKTAKALGLTIPQSLLQQVTGSASAG